MNDNLLLLFLQLIKKNGNVKSLLEHGYDYAQISRNIKLLKNENYIEYLNDSLNITTKGENKIRQINNKFNRTGSERWISPQENFKIEKISKNDIYLP
jgi:hypothetical protein